MSLITDSIFVEALTSSTAIGEYVDDRIYGTAIPVPDEDLLNEPIPYLIVSFDGLTNGGLTKDSSFEGDEDTVTISIEVAAETLTALHALTSLVRTTIRTYFDNYTGESEELIPLDYQFTAGRIEYDSMKPCYWQTLQYQCTTNSD